MLQVILNIYVFEPDKLNKVSVSLIFLQYTLSHILLSVIVSHIVYEVQVVQSVLFSNVTAVGEPVLVNCTVLPAVLAVKHRYGTVYSPI